MQSFTTYFYNFTQALQQFGLRDVVDILIIAILIYQLLVNTRHTRIFQVLKGVGVLLFAAIVADYLKLSSVHWLLNSILQSGVIFAIVIFQPEIRRALESVGRGRLLRTGSRSSDTESIIQEVSTALLRMSKRKVGALIVVQEKSSFTDIINTGTQMDSRISSALLENIFEPNTPLHDGAVILQGDRIMAAGCFLPLSQNFTISKELGTRHRAALGISELTDAVTFIVSEETGVISYTRNGKIIRYLDKKAIQDVLSTIYSEDKKESNGPIGWLLSWRNKHEED